MLGVGDIVVNLNFEKLFKIVKGDSKYAYGFNIANKDEFCAEQWEKLISVSADSPVIKYLVNEKSNKYDIGALFFGTKKNNLEKISNLIGLSPRQLARFKKI
jgi:hypothetical protein